MLAQHGLNKLLPLLSLRAQGEGNQQSEEQNEEIPPNKEEVASGQVAGYG